MTTTTRTTIIVEDETPNGGKISKQAHFALCSYCFWCASSLDGRLGEVCPSCKSSTIDSIPIAGKETLVDNYGTKCTVRIDFSHQDFLVPDSII
jgi:hypothetical protein